MNKKNGGQAFPRPASEDKRDGTLSDGDRVVTEQGGMTMRQWYKGQALAGLLARGSSFVGNNREDVAKATGNYADAMIKEDEDAQKITS